MRYIILLIAFTICSVIAMAQCAVSQFKGSHSTTYVSKFEEIYMNKDLENGVINYQVRLVLQKDNNPEVPDYYLLECLYSTSGDYASNREIVPRRIGVRLKAGERPLPLQALKEETIRSTNGLSIRSYSYEINAEALEAIKKEIVGVLFVDNRQKDYIEANPYSYLLREQLDCLQAASSK